MLKGRASTQGDNFPLNLTTFLTRSVSVFPEREIVHRTIDGEWKRSNYAELGRRVKKLANVLGDLGVGPGSAVGVLDWNSLRCLELYFGIPAVAATLVQLNLRLAAHDLEYVVSHSGTETVFVDESLLPIAEQLAPKVYVKKWVIMTDKPSSEISTTLENVVFFEDLMAEASEEYEFELIEENSAAFAGYTTGTTGRPKGIFYSHRSVVLHALNLCQTLSVTEADTVMPWTPMFHVMSWGFPQSGVAVGAKMVLPGKFSANDIAEVAPALVTEQVTLANGAPAIFAPVLEYLKTLENVPDLSRLRLVSGSTAPALALIKGFKEVAGANVIHAYGASETTPLVTANVRTKPGSTLSEDEEWDLKRSQGLPSMLVEMKIVDPAGEELPRDGKSAGELLLRGPWIAESYYKLDDNSDRFLDGWWRSGDVGVIEPTGHLRLTDRLKDVIKSGGEWISSIDMENSILDNDKVLEAAVIGVPDPKYQERPVAYVVPRPGSTVTQDDVYATLSDRFAKWQLPDQVIITEELPRTSVGKLDKKLLREQWNG
ncbi:long-chain-fatty-acid--CoA ligase [Brevibacterium paucivorans]|uniref:AMP-dependent synthetase n=1 Tax=Brevibacterium paucivorans TaxID=170994 RepID=A0A2N6VM64_9MICO|nr:long-chain-fatty-acid--CoA ligase [Brevibacterium paucivorans]PMD05177.1 AMP-dependent synthetase [Brevibacterium paucivorans]